MKYNLKQYPGNKKIDPLLLSKYQLELRKNKDKIKGKTKVCRRCLIEQPEEEFYVRKRCPETKKVLIRRHICRDCTMRQMGVKEIGKLRFSIKLLKSHFRRCTVCKEIKPLTEYYKSKGQMGGYSHNCKQCSFEKHREWFIENYEYQKPKYFINEHSFRTAYDLAKYILGAYGIPMTTTLNRIHKGCSEGECIISKKEFRNRVHKK